MLNRLKLITVPVVINKNIFILRKYTLKYLGVKAVRYTTYSQMIQKPLFICTVLIFATFLYV